MSDPAREALMTPPTELEISELLAQLTPTGALILRRLCMQRDTALAALADAATPDPEPDCTGWQERYRTGPTTGRRLWCEDGCAEWRAGWRAGMDAAAGAAREAVDAARRAYVSRPRGSTNGRCIGADDALARIRALADPDPPTQIEENTR